MKLKKAIIVFLTLAFVFNASYIGMPISAMAEDIKAVSYTGGDTPDWISVTWNSWAKQYDLIALNTTDSLKLSGKKGTATTSGVNNNRSANILLKPDVWLNSESATIEFKIRTNLAQTLNVAGDNKKYGYVYVYDNYLMGGTSGHYLTVLNTLFQHSVVWSDTRKRTNENDWTHIAISRNKTDKTVDLYIDRILFCTFPDKSSLGKNDDGLKLDFRYHYFLDSKSVLTGNPDSYVELDNIKAYEGEYKKFFKVLDMNASVDGVSDLQQIDSSGSLTVAINPGKVSVTKANYILTLRKDNRLVGISKEEKEFDTATPVSFNMTLPYDSSGVQQGDYELQLMVVEDFEKLAELCDVFRIE